MNVIAQMLPRTLRPSTTDMTAAVAWAATGGFAVIFLVQVSLQSLYVSSQ